LLSAGTAPRNADNDAALAAAHAAVRRCGRFQDAAAGGQGRAAAKNVKTNICLFIITSVLGNQ
jgi:hypothetical protein